MNILFFKLALRTILKNKFHSIINIAGFSIGIASILFIFLFLSHEASFDKFHEDGNRIYRVCGGSVVQGVKSVSGFSGHPVAADIKNEIPGIDEFCRLSGERSDKCYTNNQQYKIDRIRIAEDNFFNFFNFKLITGNPETVLNSSEKIVLSERQATKMFLNSNPLGQVITYQQNSFIVSGISENLPENTHLKFDALIPLKYAEQEKEIYWLGYGGGLQFLSYLKLTNGVNPKEIESKIPELLHQKYNKHSEGRGFKLIAELQNIEDIHLNSTYKYDSISNRNKSSLFVVAGICLLILFLAIINYFNLYVAQKTSKLDDIRILKIHGAERFKLATQTFIEVCLIALFASILSILLLRLTLPFLNNHLQTSVSLTHNLSSILIFLVVSVFTISLIITSLSSSRLLDQKLSGMLLGQSSKQSTKSTVGNILVTFQFTVVILLVAVVIFLMKQTHFLLNKELGFDKENILSIGTSHEFLNNELSPFKAEIKSMPEIKSVCLSSQPIGSGLTRNGYFIADETELSFVNVLYTDADFFDCFDVPLKIGRNFKDIIHKKDNSIIINQELAKRANWQDPVGKAIFRDGQLEVIGVTSDFNFTSLHDNIKPLIIMANPAWDGWCFGNVNIKYQTADIQSLIKKISSEWKQQFPEIPFEINFLDKQLSHNYKSLQANKKIVAFFSMLAILIASMGLFGLTLFVTKNRTKEIGIRKVNGAKITEILTMLNKDFIKWVAIAFVIACPIAYYAMNKWLENFAYKTTLSWWIFALAGVLALGIALLTVSWQSWRAATRNPVEALRYE